ncbi:MAG: hypothetical protein JXR56_05185, partial [Candidatus Cloacimonetes bacterium]|nr:hypothetical protein [Candidatus Cloacimonadota bacterium]
MKKTILFLFLSLLVMGSVFAVGGDDFASAVAITSFPYTDTGDTTTLTNVIGNPSNDAFYIINSPLAILDLDISLEFSGYDTYLRVYAADMTTQLWDNDDFYGANSALFDLALDADTDYYICVEGYSANNGAYQIDVTAVLDNPSAPGDVSNIMPTDAQANVALDTTLSWDFGANTETYDLYFDTVNPPVAQVVTDGEAVVGLYTPPADLSTATTYYWQVVSKNSGTRFETASDVFSFSTVLGGTIIEIGTGSTFNMGLPVEPYYGYTYSQCIYLQSEINMDNKRIEKIWYHYNGASDLSATTQWVIYLGHTANSQFATTTSWIPLANLTKVFEHTLDPYPTDDGWIEFVLDTPFTYNNTDNLVIAVEDNQSGYETGSDEFYCTATSGVYRGLQYQSDGTNPNPATPPTGSRKAGYANVRMEFGDLPEVPEFIITPESKDFGTVFTGFDSDPQVFTISNNGGANLVIADPIALETGEHFTLTDLNSYPLTILPAGSANFSVTYNATIAGEVTDNVIIVDNVTRTEHSIPLAGTGFEATVSSFPFTQSFDASTLPLGWVIDPTTGAWTLSQTEFGGHGATSEHTGNGGYYIGIDDSSPDIVPAHLYSPPFNFSSLSNPTLSFWYWIGDAANDSELHIDVITDLGTDASVGVFTNPAGTASNGWIQAIVGLSDYVGQTVSLDFRGMEDVPDYSGDICLDDIYIFDNSNPPVSATLVSPADAASDVALTGNLLWNAVSFADGYDLYFGTNNPPTSILNGVDQGDVLTYAYSGLATGTTYYWQVVPYNVNGDAIDCPVWSFETTASVPAPSTVSAPLDGATGVNSYGSLVWNVSTLADGYYLYFGTNTPPTNIEEMTDMGSNISYSYGPLAYSTMYYWQVVPYNAAGNAESCPIWSFTTQADPRIYAPYYQSFNGSTSIPSKWTSNMAVRAAWGIGGTNVLYKNLWSSAPTGYAVLENMTNIGSDDYVKMYYRIVNYTGAPNNPTTLGSGDAITLKASTDGGGTYSTLYTINSANHTPSTAYSYIQVPLSTYAGSDVKFRIEGQWGTGDWYILIDNFYVGPVQSKVIISEIGTTTPQYVELYNAGNIPQSLNGWSLQQQDPSATTTINSGVETN